MLVLMQLDKVINRGGATLTAVSGDYLLSHQISPVGMWATGHSAMATYASAISFGEVGQVGASAEAFSLLRKLSGVPHGALKGAVQGSHDIWVSFAGIRRSLRAAFPQVFQRTSTVRLFAH